jgi:DNA invertase Pin-like site-specific DNA recombinase
LRPRTTRWSQARYKHRTDPVFEEDPGTSSRLHLLQRPKFPELLTYARPGDTVHISETFRLVRGKGTAYLEGRSLAALARDHHISRGAIRTSVADFLRTTELEAAERAALD